MARRSLVVVANRLPVDHTVEEDGSITWSRSPGGLVSALHPVLRDRQGTWIGWSGAIDSAPYVPDMDGIRMRSVPLSSTEYEDYYEGYSNGTLWPLYHDAVETPAFHRRWWEAYERVNRRFAQATADYAERNAMVWIQDYHLQLVPAMLRALRPDLRIGFFMHIPFPPVELFMQLPRRTELLRGMLGEGPVLEAISAVCRPGAPFLVTLNLHAWRPPVPEVGELPEPDPASARTALAERYAAAGWRLTEAEYLDDAGIAALATSWTKRLGSSRARFDVLALRGTVG